MHDYSTSRGRSCKLQQMTIGGYKCYTWVTRCGQPCCLDVSMAVSTLPPGLASCKTLGSVVLGCCRLNDVRTFSSICILFPLTAAELGAIATTLGWLQTKLQPWTASCSTPKSRSAPVSGLRGPATVACRQIGKTATFGDFPRSEKIHADMNDYYM